MRGEEAVNNAVELQRQQTYSEYLRLQQLDDLEVEDVDNLPLASNSHPKRWRRWVKLSLWGLLILVFAGVIAVWGLPFLLDKVVMPIMEWEASTFSRPVLALVLIGSMAFLPVLWIPSGPSMWLAGMIFGYGLGFLIIMTGTFLGMSIPFFIGRSLFHARIQGWLQQWPKRAAVIRVVDQGGWFYQFRVVFLVRVSPIPYPLFNYAVATTNVKYGPYITGSCVGMVPEAFITIYSGKLLRTLADVKHARHHLTSLEIAYNIAGFCVAMGVTIAGTIYGRKALRDLERKEAEGRVFAQQIDDPHTHHMEAKGLGSACAELPLQSLELQRHSDDIPTCDGV